MDKIIDRFLLGIRDGEFLFIREKYGIWKVENICYPNVNSKNIKG